MTTSGDDMRRLVADSYDRIADAHLAWALDVRSAERELYGNELLTRLADRADLLELGCGAGVPTTRQLATRLTVTGVDFSARQIELARELVPQATFIHADMTRLDQPAAAFDAVAAFYSIIHVPRDDQPALLADVVRWLRPGGWFVASFGTTDNPCGTEDDFLGAPMAWSGFDSATNVRMLRDVGLDIVQIREETELEFGQPCTFCWVIARKPDDAT